MPYREAGDPVNGWSQNIALVTNTRSFVQAVISRTQARTRQNRGSSDGARPDPTRRGSPGRAEFDKKDVVGYQSLVFCKCHIGKLVTR